MTRNMLQGFFFPKMLWVETIKYCRLYSQTICHQEVLNQTPYEVWYGKKTLGGLFQSIWLHCLLIPSLTKYGKVWWELRKIYFIVYGDESKGYRLYNQRHKDEDLCDFKSPPIKMRSIQDKPVLFIHHIFIYLHRKKITKQCTSFFCFTHHTIYKTVH